MGINSQIFELLAILGSSKETIARVEIPQEEIPQGVAPHALLRSSPMTLAADKTSAIRLDHPLANDHAFKLIDDVHCLSVVMTAYTPKEQPSTTWLEAINLN